MTHQPFAVLGSSPLARGTPLTGPHQRVPVRFIPARAGNTTQIHYRDRISPVHPRSRGEHVAELLGLAAVGGSSPLARGTQPACGRREAPAAVHPRSRGEHGTWGGRSDPIHGSSPLARGTRSALPAGCTASVFIPARAGNTQEPNSASRENSVHPRSRGEHAFDLRADLWAFGSSPLARGTRASAALRSACSRFIPARAGNTRRFALTLWPATVHPRSRGEHVQFALDRTAYLGSSPLARGTHIRHLCRRSGWRFIPARAGNTASANTGSFSPSVHPRSRGEHQTIPSSSTRSPGSSPLARGTQRGCIFRGCQYRFIPARAGNTVPVLRGQ